MKTIASLLTCLVVFAYGNCTAHAGETPINQSRADYLKALGHRIYRKWYPSPQWLNLPVLLAITISSDGKLIDCKIVKSSGNAEADTTALLAVRSAAPFTSIPAALLDRDGHLSGTVTFDWKTGTGIVVRTSGAPQH